MQPSVRTLYAFASEFGSRSTRCSSTRRRAARGRRVRRRRPSRPGAAEPGLAVQRADERPAITLNSGVQWERLMFWADEDVEFIEATYEPGGASSPDESFVRHSGHEFGFVLSGTLRVVVGFDEFVLGPGDSITFPSSTPHRLSNEGDRDRARDLGRPRPRARRHEASEHRATSSARLGSVVATAGAATMR